MMDKDLIELITLGVLAFMGFLVLWATIDRLLFFRNFNPESYAKKQTLEVELTRNLSLIATIASNAPYVGLLGTVFGIMITFYQIGQGGAVEAGAIMTGLALALKATAAGLFVAIPAMIAYNLLVRKVEVLIARWEAARDA